MKKFQTKISIGSLCAQVGILLIMLMLLTYMNNAVGSEQSSTRILQVGITMTTMVLLVVIAQRGTLHISSLLVISGMLSGMMLATSYVCNGLTLSTVFPYVLKFCLWLMVYIIGYVAVKRFSCEKFIVSAVCISFVLMIGIFLSGLRTDFSVRNRNYVITAVYYVLCCMPFLFEVKNNMLKNIMLLVTAACVGLSFKRSALLVFVAVILVLTVSNLKKVKRKKTAYSIIVVCIAFIGGLIYLGALVEENATLNDMLGVWMGRFGEGNSRDALHTETIRMFFNSNIINLLLGHGYDAVLRDSVYGLSAHNDYFEILYDYGVVGFLLFLAIIMILLRKIKYIGTENSSRRNAYIASLTIFLVASIPSHMLTYSTYFLLISLYWGFAHGLVAKEQLRIRKGI